MKQLPVKSCRIFDGTLLRFASLPFHQNHRRNPGARFNRPSWLIPIPDATRWNTSSWPHLPFPPPLQADPETSLAHSESDGQGASEHSETAMLPTGSEPRPVAIRCRDETMELNACGPSLFSDGPALFLSRVIPTVFSSSAGRSAAHWPCCVRRSKDFAL